MCSLIIFALCCILHFSTTTSSNDGGYYVVLVPTIIHDHSTVSIAVSTVGYQSDEQFEVKLEAKQSDHKVNEIQKVKISQSDDTKLLQFKVSALEDVPYQFTTHGPGTSVHKTEVKVSKPSVMIFIQTDKPLYKPGDTIKFRVLVLDQLTRPIKDLKKVNVQLRDSNRNLIREWPYAEIRHGVFQSQIDLANFIPLGKWTLRVLALNDVAQTKTINVAEYVLPLHEIRISTSKTVVLKDGSMALIIDAKYTFGKPIRGIVSLAFDGTDYPHKLDINGRAVIKINLKDVVKADDFGDDFYRLEVNVKIEESVSGQIYEANEAIPIHTRSHIITLRKSSEYLLQEESIRCWLTLTDPNGVPLPDPGVMKVKVTREMRFWFSKHYSFDEKPNADGVVSLSIDSSSTTSKFELEATYDGETTKFEIRREEDFDENPKAFFTASLTVLKASLDQPVEVLVQSSFRMNFVFYHVISQGEIMTSGRIAVSKKRTATFSFLASFSMVPEASLAVFTINGAKLWSDVIRFKVHELNNLVNIELSSNSTEPRSELGLTVSSKPGSMVGLLAVDRSLLQLGTGNDITQQLVFQRLSGPKMNEGVDLESLGFTILTNTRDDLLEPQFSPDLRFSDDEVEIKKNTVLYSAAGLPSRAAQIIRKYFPETWLWTEIVPVDDKGKLELKEIVPDTITGWSISAFAIDANHGLGVIQSPASLTVLKSFFVTVNLPYSIVKTETATVEVFVHNYLDQEQSVTVRVQNDKGDFQFVDETDKTVSTKEDSKTVTVASNSVHKVIFWLKPTQSGNPTITILADSSTAADAMQRNLRVTPGGLQFFENQPRYIEVQKSSMKFPPFKLVIPRTATPGSISITFSVEGFLLGAAVANLGHIIRLPSGCGEQNMLNLVPSVIALEYMSSTDTLPDVVKAKAIDYLQKGYQNQLKYKLRDGSFSVFGESDGRGSVFLTALVAKVFSVAEKHITVDSNVLQKALDWLRNQQTSDGRFVESGKLYYKALQSGLQESATLTAYILIAFLEHKTLAQKYQSVIEKGTNFISKKSYGNPYDLAIVAYVLQLADHPRKKEFFDQLLELSQSDDERTMRWWNTGSTSIETTSYALLTYMSRGTYRDAKPIMKWLVSQRYDKGGYDNTQNTFVGLQALGQYSRVMSLSNQNYEVFVSYDSERHRFHMDAESSLRGHKHIIPPHVRQVEVSVEGTGAGVFQISHKFNNVAQDSIPRFKIEKTIRKSASNDAFNMNVCASYQPKREHEEVNMVLIEISFPSGYIVPNQVLQQLGKNKKVRRAETEDGDTRLILYFDPLQPFESVCVDVEAFRKAIVLNQAPGWIKVYDYYDPTREAIEYFDPIVN